MCVFLYLSGVKKKKKKILNPWQEIWPCLNEAPLHSSASKCIIEPNSESAIVCFPESVPMVFLTCVHVSICGMGAFIQSE